MNRLSIEDVIEFCEGKVCHKGQDKLMIDNISTDSRTILRGELFIPLCGTKFNGHYFINDVIKNGIQAVITNKNHWETIKNNSQLPLTCWIIGVEDTLKAYQEIAHQYLKRLNVIKIAVTGSNGKTTAKEIIRSIVSTHYNVATTEGNYNNQIGVPKTVFTINKTHQVAIIELGSGKKGDISTLAHIIEPDIGIITNIGEAHIEFFNGIQGVAEEKKGLFSAFHHESKAILNKDDPYFSFLKENIKGSVISFSMSEGSHFKVIKNLGLDGYLINYLEEKCRFRLPGEHNLINLCFALLVADELNIPKEKVAKGIEKINPVNMRTETTKGDYTLIKDCYNANPSSMKAGLTFFSSLTSNGKKISVLGDMLELGSDSENFHEDVGKYLSELNIDYLFTLGKLGKKIGDGAIKNGYSKQKTFSFYEKELLIKQLKLIIEKNDIIYFKASRKAELEKLTIELES